MGRYHFLIIIFITVLSKNLSAQLTFQKLTADFIENPLGIDNSTPVFGWTLASDINGEKQTAYEIIISDNLENVNNAKGNVWSTGLVHSSNSVHISYEGTKLKPFIRYYWRVKVYGQDNRPSGWSAVNWFETAMLQESDWIARWIGDGSKEPSKGEDFYKEDPAPLFSKAFHVDKKVQSARLYISGLGYYEAYLNGKKIGNNVLDAGWTSYDKQVLYATHDISPLIKKGENKIGALIGNGWYNPLPLRFWGQRNFRDALATGRPTLKAQIRIQYVDGSVEVIGTDEHWQVTQSPILRNNIFIGENHDARLEDGKWYGLKKTGATWKDAVFVDGPKGMMSTQMAPPITIQKEIKPKSVVRLSSGKYLFDMGENFAGLVKLTVKGPEGNKITLRYGEDINKDGSLNVMTSVAGQIKKPGTGGPGAPSIAWQEDNYVLKGKGIEEWMPKFTFHSFRFVEVSGWPGVPTLDNLRGVVLASGVKRAGEFSSSNEMFNNLYKVIDRTFLSNIFSVQSDCPAREKLGYGGDIVATAESFMYNYDMNSFYRKTVQDFANDQRDSGGITETAPYVGISDEGPDKESGPLGWQLAYPYLIQKLYSFYGDKSIVTNHYENVKKQVSYLRSKAQNNLYFIGLSDHEAIDERPIALTASLFYFHHIQLLASFADIVGDEQTRLESLRESAEVKEKIIQRFHNLDGKVDNGTQTAQLFSLWYDVVQDEEGQRKIIDKLAEAFSKRDWHISTGIFGTKMLFDVLRTIEKPDWAFKIANQRAFPGWGFMLNSGATTLWETWAYSDDMYSQNHPMFGSINEWFYRSILGINPASPGFEKVIIKPQPVLELHWAKGKYSSVRGDIESSWRIENTTFSMEVHIPVNCTAEIWVPTLLNGQKMKNKPVDLGPNIALLKEEMGYKVYLVNSGSYSF